MSLVELIILAIGVNFSIQGPIFMILWILMSIKYGFDRESIYGIIGCFLASVIGFSILITFKVI